MYIHHSNIVHMCVVNDVASTDIDEVINCRFINAATREYNYLLFTETSFPILLRSIIVVLP